MLKLCPLMVAILNFRSAQKNITFVEVHPMTIHAMFALNWFTGFREEILKHFPIGSHVKLCPLMVAILNFQSAKKT